MPVLARMARFLLHFWEFAARVDLSLREVMAMPKNQLAEESSFSGLEADLMVPSQFFDRIKPECSSQPEKRLMLAVMEDAIATFQKSVYGATRRQRRLLRETEEWIDSADTRWPFSFENICAALDIESTYLRTGLKHWKVTRLTRHQESERPISHSPFRRVNGRRHALSTRHISFSRGAKAA